LDAFGLLTYHQLRERKKTFKKYLLTQTAEVGLAAMGILYGTVATHCARGDMVGNMGKNNILDRLVYFTHQKDIVSIEE
jgi:hypothetical protein